MRNSSTQLIIFTRLPVPWRSKTRLIPALGAEGAALFHDRLTRHTLNRALEFCNSAAVELVIWLDGGSVGEGIAWLGERRFQEQGEGHLGARLERAMQTAYAGGAQRVVIIGTDCPALDHEILTEAYKLLDDFPVVFGPACDGGYYLVGLSAPNSAIFCGIEWGSSQVFAQSLAAAREQGLEVGLLRELSDVDLPEDLAAAELALNGGKF